MVTPEDLERLVGWMQEAGLIYLSYADAQESVTLTLEPAGAPTGAAAGPDETPARAEIRAEAIGVFLDRHPSDAAPLMTPGAMVTEGQNVGYLRTGPTLVAVRARVSGQVTECLVPTGTRVGFGTSLFALTKEP